MKKKAKDALNFYYDKEADVLYLSNGKPSAKDVSQETEDDIVVRTNPKTGEVRGLTIINFSKRSSKSELSVKVPFTLASVQ